jgi:hypothetical protein
MKPWAVGSAKGTLRGTSNEERINVAGDVQWVENRANLRMRGVSSYCLFLPFSAMIMCRKGAG